MTGNMSVVYNDVLKGVWALPIASLNNETWNQTLTSFADSPGRQCISSMNKPLYQKVQWHLEEKAKKKKSKVMVVVYMMNLEISGKLMYELSLWKPTTEEQ